MPQELNSRVNRLYVLRDRYRAAVQAVPGGAARKTDAGVQAAGLLLARAQKRFNLELSSRRRIAAYSRTPLGVATRVPTTTPQFLGLILHEQRRIATALESLR